MIKAVFIDIDDTLTNSKREVSIRTIESIKRCINKGIKIILASGRSRKEALDYQKQIGTSPYIISSNGASVYDAEKEIEIYNEILKSEIVEKLLKYSIQNDYKIRLNYKSELVMNKARFPDEIDKERTIEELENIIKKEDIVQCGISCENLEKMRDFKKYILQEVPETIIVSESKKLKNSELKPSKSYYCDVTSKFVSKGNAVEAVCKYLKLEKDEIITIGDGENDISMFEKTKNSIAMGNALPLPKQKATYITLTNDEDGVANVLERL